MSAIAMTGATSAAVAASAAASILLLLRFISIVLLGNRVEAPFPGSDATVVAPRARVRVLRLRNGGTRASVRNVVSGRVYVSRFVVNFQILDPLAEQLGVRQRGVLQGTAAGTVPEEANSLLGQALMC